jgi:dTDP-4-dehydrorhamnose 3,5-epimerase-like enzyme
MSEKPTKSIGGSYTDDRGTLRFERMLKEFKRFYVIQNFDKNTIRAWHGHEREGKYIWVAKGAALVGVKEMGNDEAPRKFFLTDDGPLIGVWIPPGNANGIKALTDSAIVVVFSTSSTDESALDDIRFPWDTWNIWETQNR